MKKIVAISVLLVSLTAAVFAQDGWTFGLMAQHTSDLIWATKMTGKSEETPAGGGATQTYEFGKYAKGAFNFFNPRINTEHNTGHGANKPDNRLLFSVKHTGENHEVYADVRLDGWEDLAEGGATHPDGTGNPNGLSGIAKLLLAGDMEDWWVKGNVGPINAQIGSAGYGGFVDTRADWGEWYKYGNDLNRFGVHRADKAGWGNNDLIVGDDFRTWFQWGKALGVGFSFGDYRVSLGHRLDPNYGWGNNPPAFEDPASSASSVNASFMFSGRPTDAISFDVFYSIMGSDPDTFGWTTLTGDALPDGKWQNLIGAYVGINAIENLGLSIGYTANFNVYEKAGYISGTATDPSARSFTTPFYSGIDIHATYSGIDKIWINFNNNISFAGVKGKEIKGDNSHNEVVVGLDGKALGKDKSEDWFHWDTRLAAKLSLIEDVGIRVIIANRLGIQTDKDSASGAAVSSDTSTRNNFHVSASAEYGIGAVTVGAGLFFEVESKVRNQEGDGGFKFKGNTDVVSFGIPILFKVAF